MLVKVSRPKKGQGGKETHQKKSCRGSKEPFQMYMAGKNTTTKFKPQNQ